jgi:hypothetical protein
LENPLATFFHTRRGFSHRFSFLQAGRDEKGTPVYRGRRSEWDARRFSVASSSNVALGVWGCTRNCESDGACASPHDPPLLRRVAFGRCRNGKERRAACAAGPFQRPLLQGARRQARRPACVRDEIPRPAQLPLLLGISHRQQPPGPEACGVLAPDCRFCSQSVPCTSDRGAPGIAMVQPPEPHD